MASITDVFINPITHIEVINEESVKLMQLKYGNLADTHGDQRYTAYGKHFVKGSLKVYSRYAGCTSARTMCVYSLKEWVLLDGNLTEGPYGWELKKNCYHPV